MTVSFGPELRRLRLAANVSLSELSRRAHYSKGHLSKIETGGKKAGPELARACDAALNAGGALIRLEAQHAEARPRGGGRQTRITDAALHVGNDGAGHYAEHFGWDAPRQRDGGRHLYEWHRMMFDMLRGRGQVTAPGLLLPHLILHTRELTGLAATTRRPGQFWLLAARFAEYTGWMAQESGNEAHALYWTERAVEYANEAGDRHLGAYALVRRAELAMYRSQGPETVALAQQAQALDCGRRIRGLAAQREAQGHALAGNASACLRALDRAEQLLTGPDHDGPLPALGTTNVADLNGMAKGFSLVDLGQSARASELLRTQLERTAPFADRMKARIGARYSLALVGAGDLEQGCVEAQRVLDWCADADSSTIRKDLRRLSRTLGRWQSNQHVREVLPGLTAALTAA